MRPAAQVTGPAISRDQDRIAGAGGASNIQQRLEARDLPGAQRIRRHAAVLPAVPTDVVRLVVEVEDDRRISTERPGNRALEGGRVIAIGHRPALTGAAVGRDAAR